MQKSISAIDLFCGIGGLSHGLLKTGIKVKAGFDLDESCRYPFETNNNSSFFCEDISGLTGEYIINKFWNSENEIKILVGCAPCQPFSSHTFKIKDKEKGEKWNLLESFGRLVQEIEPDIVSMENVPNLSKHKIFSDFVEILRRLEYSVFYDKVYCPDYGIPQKRTRLVLLASKLGEIKLIPKTHKPKNYKTTKAAIGKLPKVKGGERHEKDPLHITTKLSEKNLLRIKSSKPNGSWKDWDESLRLDCHKKSGGKSYVSVYGRMGWGEPSPTITTQFYNYGTGRFGHPEQDRALTIREAALLQTFPKYYKFYEKKEEISMTRLGTHIGNAVPVKLAEVIGKSILQHVKKHYE